jgi:hypothetical protein
MIPRWLRTLERLMLQDDDREFLGGDLEEAYWLAVRRESRLRAQLKYARVQPRDPVTFLGVAINAGAGCPCGDMALCATRDGGRASGGPTSRMRTVF